MKKIQIFSQAAINTASVSELDQVLRHAVGELGYDQIQLLRFRRAHFVDAPIIDVPESFAAWRAAQKWDGHDAMTECVSERRVPILWSSIEASDQKADAEQRHWVAAAQRHGMHDGVSIPIEQPDFSTDILSLSRSAAERPRQGPADFWALTAIGYVVTARLRQLEQLSRFENGAAPQLSDRELEVLRWSKDGKSYAEIGTIMGISGKTVEFHMTKAMRKLSVNQKIAAVMACARLGLLDL